MKSLSILFVLAGSMQLFSCTSSTRDENKGVRPREGEVADTSTVRIDEHGAVATDKYGDTTVSVKVHTHDTVGVKVKVK